MSTIVGHILIPYSVSYSISFCVLLLHITNPNSLGPEPVWISECCGLVKP